MARPRLLDLFCGAGGASMGYHRAGFEVVGVDSEAQPRYPFEFHQADALTFPLDGFAAIHASPPCQAYSRLRTVWKRKHAELVGPTRDRLVASGLPYVIENVPGSPLDATVTLCGGALGLGSNGRHLQRHRLFEASFAILAPPCVHWGRTAIGVYGQGRWDNESATDRGGYQGSKDECAEAMRIDWMTRDGLVQAIPPDYTELIGWQLLAQLPPPRAPLHKPKGTR